MGGEGGRHAGGAFLDRKAVLTKEPHIPVGGAVFAPGGLAEIEDGGGPGRQIGSDRVDMGKRVGLGG
jgi:hypothetical protein